MPQNHPTQHPPSKEVAEGVEFGSSFALSVSELHCGNQPSQSLTPQPHRCIPLPLRCPLPSCLSLPEASQAPGLSLCGSLPRGGVLPNREPRWPGSCWALCWLRCPLRVAQGIATLLWATEACPAVLSPAAGGQDRPTQKQLTLWFLEAPMGPLQPFLLSSYVPLYQLDR